MFHGYTPIPPFHASGDVKGPGPAGFTINDYVCTATSSRNPA